MDRQTRSRHPRAVTRASTRQRGVALVTALLIVSLATVAATQMATRQQVDVRRTGNMLHGEQAYAYAVAAESWARVILRRDLRESDYDSLEEDWATALPPIAVEGGLVSGRIEDLQGRYNVNNLLGEDGKESAADLEYFRRLLSGLELDPELVFSLLDWMDADIEVRAPDGAEDEAYLLLDRPYRTANRPLVDPSELRLISGFTAEVVQILSPHISVLPQRTPINVNTATPAVLQALHEQLGQSDAEMLISDRGDTGYENTEVFLSHAVLAGLELGVEIDVKTDHFRVLTDVAVGSGRARLSSLMARDENTVSVISRVRSRERLFELSPSEQRAAEIGEND